MYKIKGIVYADAGSILVSEKFRGYQYKGNLEDFTEISIDLDSGRINGEMVQFNDGIEVLDRHLDYAGWKTNIVKWRYSNDDQIAIMLNRDNSSESGERYQKMQEWREWAGNLARKIISLTQG